MDVTKDISPQPPVRCEPFLTCDCESGRFIALTDEPLVSSARKRIYRGEFYARDAGRYAAVAVVFNADDASFYGREVAALSRSAFLGCGPAVYELAGRVNADEAEAFSGGGFAEADSGDDTCDIDTPGICPVIIEEDAGISLEEALFCEAEVPGTPDNPEWASPLGAIGSAKRDAENAKIMFDLRVQLYNLHEAGLYHRDVRPANVCLRRFGENPQDIRATIVDHELVDEYAGVAVPAASEHYEHVLFEKLPHEINPLCCAIEPTSLMRDLGYLAAIEFQCMSGQRIDAAQPADFDVGEGGEAIFSYAADGMPVIHMIDPEIDIVPLARALGLTPVDEAHFPDPYMLRRVQSSIAHGGFLDARDLETISHWNMGSTDAQTDRLARDVVYKRWEQLAADQGRKPAYDDFDSQPELMQASNIDQVRDIPNKIRLLGYRIVSASSGAAKDRITCLTPAEIEYAAYLEHRRWTEQHLAAGWVYGVERDDERRTHPDLVNYDELSEREKEYDRQAARNMIDVLAEVDLAVVR